MSTLRQVSNDPYQLNVDAFTSHSWLLEEANPNESTPVEIAEAIREEHWHVQVYNGTAFNIFTVKEYQNIEAAVLECGRIASAIRRQFPNTEIRVMDDGYQLANSAQPWDGLEILPMWCESVDVPDS